VKRGIAVVEVVGLAVLARLAFAAACLEIGAADALSFFVAAAGRTVRRIAAAAVDGRIEPSILASVAVGGGVVVEV